jgi:hypothetical protein
MVTMLLSGSGVFASEVDDYIPDVTDRVARISFVQGDVQIRREDGTDWEVAVLNLPIVEGDEIATDGNGRLEIQFNSYTHLRIAENSQVKFVGLKDGGIALSVPLGTVVIRASEFDGAKAYFEVDAPKSTISIQRAGIYKIEAGVPDSLEVIVTATGGGEARVYSSDSGFTVKDGRRAKLYIGGTQSGEFETALAERFSDEFDSWSRDRDIIIAQRIKDAHYDQYYDQDMYGAEDLNDYGEWINTRAYGYVWRPYQTSVSRYTDWSPYRYGQWRWVPQYGWTWVNDEPWGWATYHHGRWVWDNGSWFWTPYAQYRSGRSWWHPALVIISSIGGGVYWYPLPYDCSYYNYNSHYHRRRHNNGYNHNGNNGGGGHQNPNPTPTPAVGPTTSDIVRERLRQRRSPFETVPTGGVVTVPASEFGRGKTFSRANVSIAKTILAQAPVDTPPIILPTFNELNGKVSQEIRSTRTPTVRPTAVTTGATPRNQDTPLDQELRKTRMFGGRPPIGTPNTSQGEPRTVVPGDGPRRTGAIERPVIKRDETAETPAPTTATRLR